jgi:putative proteasome-type protease
MRLDAGLVFLSDSRTNAGVDQVGTFRKMFIFENPGDRMLVLMSAGNLSISQSVRQIIADYKNPAGKSIWTANSMVEVAQIVGDAVRIVHERDAKALKNFNIDFNVSLILGGQIDGERCRMFQIYSAGNFIESQRESPYFQIGEAKYGKPIIDRIINPSIGLDEAAKCALISMDSTLRSNISVGLPLDLLIYQTDSLAVSHFVTIDEKNQYFKMIHDTWGQQLKSVFDGIVDPVWEVAVKAQSEPIRVSAPPALRMAVAVSPLQAVAQDGEQRQHS